MADSSSKTSPNPQIQSFLESLRQRSGGLNQPDSFPSGVERFQEKKRLEEQRKAEFFRSRQREFNQVYSHQQQSEEQKVEQIRLKLQSLAQSIKNLNQEVYNATTQATPRANVGIYHQTFLENLAEVIDLLKRQVDSSSSWLHLFNNRNRKRSYYWGMVDKKGSSFMLNNERQVATSVG